ncbi:MAG: hypothetical protein A2X13_00820 [Bacteroidetes bacterium GWC2_33_15]|nr:MAG: hypothetical protein A2X10_04635 [Bacteroidetes bacterium GWA2_33_15]OFX51160.1 MAG: hypothetical protein A2X13_00820 [Bacteroidetes bacterium GWC2_33_15]OFX66407.1 MAG: hypothetical protein A2X15_07135 [Bacteroidetes bacterium GWB2_32_14]OFX70368.1 MAG: hypothetical protein A2X14_03710 [Bacteroidetes bacterium GWD2_33_33]HAN17373.1 hypothetical protein [Bacteroidales bacterium]
MKKVLILTSIFILAISGQLSAQSDTLAFKKTIYSFMPQYLINRGIRIDIEKQISGKHFIQICPQFYLSEKDNDESFVYDENSYNSLIGGGVNVYHKIFAHSNFTKNGLYFSYGVSYNYFEIEYFDEYLGSTINANATIQKMGFDITLGYQFMIKQIISIDIFTGAGTRYSIMETNSDNKDKFNATYFGYNYTGNLLLLGARIGVIL